MLLGSVQICGEKLTSIEVKDMCESLEANNIRLLALRECKVSDKDFKSLVKAIGVSKAILQLNLNLGMVTLPRVETLSRALFKNRSLTALFLHGSPLGDRGTALLCKMIASHPHIVSLDLGDCMINDAAIPFIADLLPPNGAKRGLEDLILSANPGVTSAGWTKLFIALSASCCLKTLSLDYNKIGDYGAGCLSVALPALRKLEILDLEGSGITQYGGEILLYTVRSYPVTIKQLILTENTIRKETVYDIEICLRGENGSTMTSRVDLSNMDDKVSTDSMSTVSSFAPGTIISKDTIKRLQETSDEESSGTLEESDGSDDSDLVPVNIDNGKNSSNGQGTLASSNNGRNNSGLSTGEAMEQAYAAALKETS